jgi:sporulation protein YlmC with PRC-barrel domain
MTFKQRLACHWGQLFGEAITGRRKMKIVLATALAAALSTAPAARAAGQVAGQSTIGVTVEELRLVVLGWSAKQKLLNHSIYNDRNEDIGKIEDVIVSPKRTVSWAIVGVGGFLGINRKDVAIPMNQLRFEGEKLVLPGATKQVLKDMPGFSYAQT